MEIREPNKFIEGLKRCKQAEAEGPDVSQECHKFKPISLTV